MSRNEKIKTFCLGVITGAMVTAAAFGIGDATRAHADPSCSVNNADGTCQWWQNLPSTGSPGYGPSHWGPNFYTPCTDDAASKASPNCINGE